MKRDGTRDFHEARWDEPILMELGEPGQRALLLEEIEPQVAQAAGAPDDLVPQGYLRREAPELPELGQMQLLRHYLRLSQETIGADLNIDIGLGTCTMKYNPKVHESFVRDPRFSELHPYQDPSTTQGILQVLYETEQYLRNGPLQSEPRRRFPGHLLQRGHHPRLPRGPGRGGAAG